MAAISNDLVVPTITEDDLKSFHAKHFPGTSLPLQFFLSGSEHIEDPFDEEYYEETDDGLGYYSDGAKRFLTDTQISIFRHSEIQRILWREAGEYAGPIFQPVSKPKGRCKIKAASRSSEQQKQLAHDGTGNSNKHQMASKNVGGDPLEDAASLTEEPKSVREASAMSTGSNYTPPTASKKKRKKNKKENTRLAARASATVAEQAARRMRAMNVEQRRANSSSPERGEQPIKRTKVAAGVQVAVEERNNPDDFKADGEAFTFRRLARDEDDVKDVALELEY